MAKVKQSWYIKNLEFWFCLNGVVSLVFSCNGRLVSFGLYFLRVCHWTAFFVVEKLGLWAIKKKKKAVKSGLRLSRFHSQVGIVHCKNHSSVFCETNWRYLLPQLCFLDFHLTRHIRLKLHNVYFSSCSLQPECAWLSPLPLEYITGLFGNKNMQGFCEEFLLVARSYLPSLNRNMIWISSDIYFCQNTYYDNSKFMNTFSWTAYVVR